MLRTFIIILVVGAAVVLFIGQPFFTVRENEQALVLQFGEVRRELREPGLKVKIPFFQQVIKYEKRTLDLDPPSFEVLLTDKKRIIIDAFVRYRITEPSVFYQRVTTEDLLRDRFGRSVSAALQRVIATVSLTELLSQQRQSIMDEISIESEILSRTFGISIVDVRIGRTDLPEETSQAVFNRMRTEREREARELRAEGGEIAQKIEAQADKERTVLLAEARRKADALRGEGEASRNKILAEAYNRDREFFEFYRSLETYRDSLANQETTLILRPEGDYFDFFRDQSGGR